MTGRVVATLADLALDRASDVPLHRQIYAHVRRAIVTGRFPSGTRLPSTRVLATSLGLSRNTVSHAYEQLIDEGFLEAQVGSGTRVPNDLPRHLLDAAASTNHTVDELANHAPLSRLGQAYAEASPTIARAHAAFMTPASFVPFSPAVPALDAFPRRAWEKAIAKAWRDLDQADLGYSRPGGYGPLREAIADHMRETRGVRCDVEQVIVTSGTQQALSLVARVVLDPGDVVWTEDPCFYGLHVLLRTMRARVVPVPVDADGIVVEDGIATAPDAKVAFVSPSHQYPLGTTMSLSRRLQLLRWAREMGAWLVEDDYDSEFRFSGYPLQALQGLDPSGRVIYTGTFSKSLFPSLRLGYLVVPPALLDPVAAAQAFGDRGASLMAQVALHRFMVSGQFGRHIRTMRLLYARRQQALLEAVATHLADLIDIDATPAGLHAVGWFRGDVDDVAASTALRDAGIEAPSVSSMALGEVRRRGLVLGYTTPEDALLSAAERARGILLGAGVRPWS